MGGGPRKIVAAGAALVMGLYSLTLPHTPPKGANAPISLGTLLGFDALKLMRDRSFASFMGCSFLICVPLSFYFSWMNVFMTELKIENSAAKMTLGQVSDVVFLILLPLLLPRLGVKGVLLVGIAAWAVRFGLFSAFVSNSDALWMLFVGIGVHGSHPLLRNSRSVARAWKRRDLTVPTGMPRLALISRTGSSRR